MRCAGAHQLRPAASDSPAAEAVKVLARPHKTLIWERARWCCGCGPSFWEYFPAAVAAIDDLDAPDALELMGKAPDPARAAKLTRAQVPAALKHAGRYKIAERTDATLAALRSLQLGRPPVLTAAYAAAVRSLIAVITTLNEPAGSLQGQVEAHFGQHPDAEIYPVSARPGRDNRRAKRGRRGCPDSGRSCRCSQCPANAAISAASSMRRRRKTTPDVSSVLSACSRHSAMSA
jgi:hypothetical protein